MNSRERILTAIRLEKPDRVPCSPHVGPNMVEQMTDEEWQVLLQCTDVTMSVSALGDEQIFGGQYWIDHTTVSQQGDSITTTVETPKGILQSRRVVTREANWVAEHWYKSPTALLLHS